jgi:hypothetical protein
MQRDFSSQHQERGRGLRFALALGFLAISAAAVTAACSNDGEVAAGGDNPCVGGIVIDGVCEGQCTPDKCIAENTCVHNRCRLKCDSHLDCYDTQDCTADAEDTTNAPVSVCQDHIQATGMGVACPFGNECDMFTCANGTPCDPMACGGNPAGCTVDTVACAGNPDCTIGKCPDQTACVACAECLLRFPACPDGSRCDQCGRHPETCLVDTVACGGDPNCNKGRCPDSSPCTVPTCAPSECKPLSCLTQGEGDAEAYCSKLHCDSDTECPGGYYCGIARDPHAICGLNKGNTTFCGQTTEPCIDPASFTQDGANFSEGQECLLRTQCMKRGQCAPCASDLDCSQVASQRCVTIGPDARCARNCKTDGDCDPDYFCVANPSPTDPANGSCVPRFGACKGTGQFCEPCQNDTDCGGPSSTVVCIEGSGGQRACFDRTFSTSCMSDADCPISPSGKHGECFDEGEGYAPGDSVYHKCYLPYKAAENKYGCW